jgi:predicted Zn-dependent peptidase
MRYAGMADDATPGMTHLIEKLAALGTVHRKAGEHDAQIDAAGGFTTSSTSLDALSFVTQVPAEQLPLALWLEAERMAGLADGITEQSLADAKTAIAGEYKAAYEIEPYALLPRAVHVAMFGTQGAIARDPLGDGRSLKRVTLEDARAAVRERFRPSRATLVISGEFDVTEARKTEKRYFGWMPDDRHEHVRREPDARRDQGAAACCTRLTKAGRGSTTEIAATTAAVVVAYHLPRRERDDMRFAVLGRILAGSASAILVRDLVDTGRSSDVRVDVSDEALEVWATPTAGADLAQIATDIRRVVKEAAIDIAMWGGNVGAASVTEAARRAVELDRLQVLENLAGRARFFSTGSSAYATSVSAAGFGTVLSGEFRENRAITVIARPVAP